MDGLTFFPKDVAKPVFEFILPLKDQVFKETFQINYMFSSKVYALSGKKAACIRQKGMSTIQEIGMIESHVDKFGSISRKEVIMLCKCNKSHANYLLRKMVEDGEIAVIGKGRNTQYKRDGQIAK